MVGLLLGRSGIDVVVLDMLVYPDVDLRPIRLWLSLVAVSVLLFGFIWDEDA